MSTIPSGAFRTPTPLFWLSSGIPGLSEDCRTWTDDQWVEHRRLASLDAVLQKQFTFANLEVYCDAERLAEIPSIYQMLFYRTKKFADTVRALATTTAAHAPYAWGGAACILIDWTLNVLRHKAVRFHNFLQSQRESIYWILDDALLHILLNQWENDSADIPWDKATAPIRLAFSKAQALIPDWVDQELEELQIWELYLTFPKESLEKDYFRRSRQFLEQSTRIHEVWRTVRMCGKGQLPAELANAIVEDVSRSEDLPTGNLRALYFPKDKDKKK
ncbi:Nn.00g104310.m01.CDS01 [Neocucurbitaria sp. VM-36]